MTKVTKQMIISPGAPNKNHGFETLNLLSVNGDNGSPVYMTDPDGSDPVPNPWDGKKYSPGEVYLVPWDNGIFYVDPWGGAQYMSLWTGADYPEDIEAVGDKLNGYTKLVIASDGTLHNNTAATNLIDATDESNGLCAAADVTVANVPGTVNVTLTDVDDIGADKFIRVQIDVDSAHVGHSTLSLECDIGQSDFAQTTGLFTFGAKAYVRSRYDLSSSNSKNSVSVGGLEARYKNFGGGYAGYVQRSTDLKFIASVKQRWFFDLYDGYWPTIAEDVYDNPSFTSQTSTWDMRSFETTDLVNVKPAVTVPLRPPPNGEAYTHTFEFAITQFQVKQVPAL